jgi:hypothetical protein
MKATEMIKGLLQVAVDDGSPLDGPGAGEGRHKRLLATTSKPEPMLK